MYINILKQITSNYNKLGAFKVNKFYKNIKKLPI